MAFLYNKVWHLYLLRAVRAESFVKHIKTIAIVCGFLFE